MVPDTQNEGVGSVASKKSTEPEPVPEGLDLQEDAIIKTQFQTLLAELTIALGQGPSVRPPVTPPRPTRVVEENEAPRPITGNPVLARGTRLGFRLAHQSTRGRLVVTIAGVVGITLLVTAIATFRLPTEPDLEGLKEVSTILTPLTIGTLIMHYRSKQLA